MRQIYPNSYGQDQQEWEEILENVKLSKDIIGPDHLRNFIITLEGDKRDFHCGYTFNFLQIECLRRWKDDLKPKFEMLLDDLYLKKSKYCFPMILKHFNDMDYVEIRYKIEFQSENFKSYLNKNLSLKFLLQYKEPDAWRKFYTPSGIHDSYFNTEEERDDYRRRKD